MRMGKNEPRKVMKTMLSSFEGQSMIDIGTQAMAGMGRNTSDTGKMNSRMTRKRPMTRPSGTATMVASRKPMRIRRQLSTTWEKNFGSLNARAARSSTCSGDGTLRKRT